ncbi:PDZ domain-containing protein [Pelotomaculum propionicicum]|uniref:Cell division topological determinant MinJ n=1 Tax=Pelotomaculum propionicicum TaxID=258475 RepID=A0A4Y7RN73_9FIRM|nr:PDZ domain-containing protein [Pelotomaculum propionicicum]NLI11100.1 PDZ domain-containing protein [Peptococcaceae bacterium]TEB10122.1 Cell division topological determinant MinJ [Pelotomaculum propionicicum]
MFPFSEVLPLIFISFLQAFADPAFLFLFLVVFALIAVQYNRMERLRTDFFGVKTRRSGIDILVATGFGLLGGLAGSCLLVFVGLTISGDLYYLWPVAVLLMLVNIRFLCFAYAGGILALSSLLLGYPQISVPQILALVAILHMVESFLILASGHLGAVPAYVKGPEGNVVGGFTLQKFWPIPIVALVVLAGSSIEGSSVAMPDWWPLINPVVQGDLQNLIFMLQPLVAGLGYGDIAIARSPVEKSRLSALFLGIYSLTLLALALLAGQSRIVAFFAALLSPLGHEAVIYIGKRIELKGKPLYVPSEQGLRVMDVLPGGPAWRSGLRPGDVVMSINGIRPLSNAEFRYLMQNSIPPVAVDYHSRSAGTSRSVIVAQAVPGQTWGLAPVPESNESRYLELLTTGPLGRWLQQAWGKFMR